MKYFLGLSSTYSGGDTLRHTFATGTELDLSALRAYLAAHYGATFDHTAVYANGRTALTVALRAVAPRGSKVIITSLTCYTVTQAVKAAGCVPIYADINKETLHFCKKELEEALKGEKDVKAVIVQNNLGVPADIAGIEEVCKAHKLEIIEDLAHCAGIRYADGREAGTVGRAVALSFGKGKSIDAVSGGAVVFPNPLDPPVVQPVISPVFKDNFRARIYPLICAITRGLYGLHPKIARGFMALQLKIHAVKLAADGEVDPKTRLTYWQCKLALHQLQTMSHRGRKPLRDFYFVNNREPLLKELEAHGYFFRDVWYNLPVAPERYLHKSGFREESCPNAVKAAQTLVNVPTWYSKEEMAPAVRLIKEYLTDDSDAATAAAKADERINQQKAAIKDARAKKRQRKAEAAKSALKKLSGKAAKTKQDLADKKKKSDAKKAEKKQERAEEKRVEAERKEAELSALDQKSGLLSAAEKETVEKAAETTPEKTPEPEKPAENPASKKDLEKAPEKPATPVKSVNPAPKTVPKPAAKSEEIKGPAGTDSMTGMRVAPEKLSDREKLKQKLESGEGSTRSVF